MKKLILGMIIAPLFVSSVLLANGKILKPHLKLTKDGAKVDCAYCHKSPANLPKKRGQDIPALKKTATCAGEGCHK